MCADATTAIYNYAVGDIGSDTASTGSRSPRVNRSWQFQIECCRKLEEKQMRKSHAALWRVGRQTKTEQCKLQRLDWSRAVSYQFASRSWSLGRKLSLWNWWMTSTFWNILFAISGDKIATVSILICFTHETINCTLTVYQKRSIEQYRNSTASMLSTFQAKNWNRLDVFNWVFERIGRHFIRLSGIVNKVRYTGHIRIPAARRRVSQTT